MPTLRYKQYEGNEGKSRNNGLLQGSHPLRTGNPIWGTDYLELVWGRVLGLYMGS